MKINVVENDQITRENIETESLVNIILENFDPSNLFHNPEAADKARILFVETSINEKINNIIRKFESLTQEYSDDAILDVFRDVINTDHQLFLDIITAAYYISIKYSDKKYIQHMYNICDIINADSQYIIPDKNESISEEDTEEVTETVPTIFDEEEDDLK